MPTETDALLTVLEREFQEADRLRRAATELPARLAGLRVTLRAAIHAGPVEVAELVRRYPGVARLLPDRSAPRP